MAEKRYYVGIGSRKTPANIRYFFQNLAKSLAERGWVLRSGNSSAADKAFEAGALDGNGDHEIYLPWPGFGGHNSPLYGPGLHRAGAAELGAQLTDGWNDKSTMAKQLYSRSLYQVLGGGLTKPAEFVVCWSPLLGDVGAARTTMAIATRYQIPVFNFAESSDVYHKLLDIIE